MPIISWRKAGPAAAAAALLVAFVVAPGPLAAIGSGGTRFDEAGVRSAFLGYWNSGDRQLSPELRDLVDYWLRYHVAKGLIAALLLAVFVLLAVRVHKAFLALAVLALVTVMANVQGAVAPFASLFPMLTDAPPPQLQQQLDAAAPVPAVAVMVDDFARYHVAMAVIAAVVAVALVALSVPLWRRSRAVTAGLLVLAVPMLVIAVANTGTAADPAPALAALFHGGW
ncbi:hypothetical protein BJY16_005130 [Actinoplanes octamycinicus]|uniref:Uncharacterized protein n=1 Tax=Actinoplanes octamycinicus TaxID=135948 RepID=A0A7W7H0E4_9ACTN|nr:hypothetical protein [Actinoplanes octamycinicus]MBB4741671.1 hypothetical protein [Actinoplanes octamycinicus]GIE57224.1 hypothetical protein Aoc01nite_26260 [Actinoplanes octamycinicus]